MKNINLWETNKADNVNYYSSLQEVLDYIKTEGETNFYVIDNYGLKNNEYVTIFINIIASKAQEQNLNVIYFDNNRCAFTDAFSSFCISESFYEKHKQQINDAIIENLCDCEYHNISKEIYSEELIKKLIPITKSITFEEDVELSPEIIKLLKDNFIHAKKRSNDNDIIISSDMVLGNSYTSIISDESKIGIKSNIEDYENLKLIPEHKQIFIINDHDDYQGYNNVCKIIDTLRINGQNNDVIIEIDDRRKLFSSELIKRDYDNVKVKISYVKIFELKDLKQENKILELMVKDIKESNYSPLEKFLAVFNIVKKFKEYNENNDNKEEARNVTYILNNEYMVCVGFANLLSELLYKVGIETYDFSVGVDTSYDAGFTNEEKQVKEAGHARLIVNINDPKYGINGFYQTDATWDNDLINDYYNHALISFEKNKDERRYFFLHDIDIILNSNSFEEFKNNINYIIDKNIKKEEKSRKKQPKTPQEKIELYKEVQSECYIAIIRKLFNLIKDLDSNAYDILNDKYNELFKYSSNFNYDLANEFLTEVGYYIVEKKGHDIPLETIIEASGEIYKNIYNLNEEQLDNLKKDLLEKNIERDKKDFPYYYEESYKK